MERFKRYEEEFLNASKIILANNSRLKFDFKGQKSAGFDSILHLTVNNELEISEAQGYLAAMEAETKGMSEAERTLMTMRVDECKGDLVTLQRKFEESSVEAERQWVHDAALRQDYNPVAGANGIELRSTGLLQDSQATIAQTDEIGNVTIGNLSNQRYMLLDGK
jgi:hypothetical protein